MFSVKITKFAMIYAMNVAMTLSPSVFWQVSNGNNANQEEHSDKYQNCLPSSEYVGTFFSNFILHIADILYTEQSRVFTTKNSIDYRIPSTS